MEISLETVTSRVIPNVHAAWFALKQLTQSSEVNDRSGGHLYLSNLLPTVLVSKNQDFFEDS